MATVAGHDDVAILGPESGVPARNQEPIAFVARGSLELPGESEAVPLRDASGETHVLAGALLVALTRGLPCEGVESLDPLRRDAHAPVIPSRRLKGSVPVMD